MAISLKSAQPHAPDEIAMTDTHALIPAAGVGERMGLKIPKQYESLAGRPLMAHAIETLCAHAAVRKVFVVLAPGDMRFRLLDWGAHTDKIEALYCGGATRAATVFNGLQAMQGQVQEHDWVMVHDAARPCLTHELIGRLLREVSGHDVGGLLAVPLADTLKRASRPPSVTKGAEEVETTVARDQLWQAQTPQMFRHGLLLDALRKAGVDDVTDESSAVERLGYRPRLVTGSPRNLKVTRPEDALLAELILKL